MRAVNRAATACSTPSRRREPRLARAGIPLKRMEQIYRPRDRRIHRSCFRHARQCAMRVIVITLDYGWSHRDIKSGGC